MALLVLNDYILGGSISSENLEQIIKQARQVANDYTVLDGCENRAISNCLDYISAKYRTDEIFAPNLDWSAATAYVWNDRIYLTADSYNAITVYATNDYVLYNSKVYQKNATSGGYVAGTLPTNATYFNLIGNEGFYYITPPAKYQEGVIYLANVYVMYNFDVYKKIASSAADVLPTDTDYWEKIPISQYSTEFTSTGNLPTDTTKWNFGDNRNHSIVRTVCDLSLYYLHAVINPRNIPALRADRYEQSTTYLMSLMEGKLNPVLPQYGAQFGYKIRFGSNEPFNTIY
jgi:hypothetical protein